ncbi:hypothetical protein Tco_0389000 [Tanacetum coccineum]
MEFRTNYKTLLRKEIEGPEALDFADFGRHSAKEKVTLEDLFFFYSMDGGALVDVPWNIAKLMTNAYLRRVTLGQGNTLLNIVKLVELGIYRYNGLGLGELFDDMLDNSKDEVAVAEARRAHDEADGVRRHPNMSFTNRLRAMDDRLDLGVQQGVNFMANSQDFYTAPTASTDPFGMFGTPGAGLSTSHNFRNNMDKE